MGRVIPIAISTRYQALQHADAWEARAQHLEEYALTLELIIASYKLELAVERRETERLRGLIE